MAIVVHALIATATRLALACAPSPLTAFKTLMVSINTGVEEFQEDQSE